MAVTVVILTLDEARHIERALRSVAPFADRCVVVDSGSTDDTVAIAREMGADDGEERTGKHSETPARYRPHPPKFFDLGCGNGSVAAVLGEAGWDVTGVDPSLDGISVAKVAFPALRLEPGSAYDDLASSYGRKWVTV